MKETELLLNIPELGCVLSESYRNTKGLHSIIQLSKVFKMFHCLFPLSVKFSVKNVIEEPVPFAPP